MFDPTRDGFNVTSGASATSVGAFLRQHGPECYQAFHLSRICVQGNLLDTLKVQDP